MEQQRRVGASLAFACSLAATALLATSFAADSWVSAALVEAGVRGDSTVQYNASSPGTGALRFGLFNGYRVFAIFGNQPRDLTVTCDWNLQVCGLSSKEDAAQRSASIVAIHANSTKDNLGKSGLFNFSVWISIETLAAAGMFWGCIAMIFAAMNAFIIPIETINGIRGLYLWNALGGLCSAATLVVFGASFASDLKLNALLEPEDLSRGWKVDGEATFGWTAWLPLAAVAAFCGGCLSARLALSRATCCSCLSSSHSSSSSAGFGKVDAKTKEMTMLF